MSAPKKPTREQKLQMRSAARLYAVQALFQMEAGGVGLARVQEEFESHRMGGEIEGDTYADGDINLFRDILAAAVHHQARIDQETDAALVERWPLGKVDPTLRALFRAAGAELVALGTPPKVCINEFVDVAKAFFPEGKESRFVNGVLDHMARNIKPDAFKP